MLVMLTNEKGVSVVQEAWYRHGLLSPPGYTILRLGISAGCSVTPFQQVSQSFVFLCMSESADNFNAKKEF